MRRLRTMTTGQETHFTLWNIGSQQIHVSCDGGRIVSDAGLLTVRALEKPLRVIAGLAERLPDPRSPKFIRHSAEAILTQEVYQILAGYPDFNDAQDLRHDPLFQILADVSPDAEQPLASPATLSRFQYAFTRRQAELPPADRPVLLEVRAAQTGRIKVLNDYLADLFVRTRRTPPAEVILDVDATDDPVHGRQALSGYHGYYRQHQYLPLLVYDGASGFPLAAWLRPGTVHASCGAAQVLGALVTKLRAAWPGVRIRIRSDNGLAVPGLYDYCEANGLPYAFGYAALRGAVGLPGGRLAAPAADRGQARGDAPGEPAAVRGHQPGRPAGGGLPRLLRAAGRRAGAADRGDEERAALRPAVGLRLQRQRLPAAGAYRGLCHRRAVPGGAGGGAGVGGGHGEHPAAAAVEGGGGGGDERSPDRAAAVADLAARRAVGAGAVGGASVRGAAARGVPAGAGSGWGPAHVRGAGRSKQP